VHEKMFSDRCKDDAAIEGANEGFNVGFEGNGDEDERKGNREAPQVRHTWA
jgi:hypothetical protein